MQITQNDLALLPDIVSTLGKQYFGQITLLEGLKLIRASKVSISFTKGSPENYYIVSGIVKDDRAHESKIVFKKRLEGSPEGPFSSNCDCHRWNKDDHCIHTASLFISYHLSLSSGKNFDLVSSGPLPSSSFDYVGAVTPNEYGTIVASAYKLEGATPQSTYSSLQYRLTNGKITHFPLPQSFVGKLVISYSTTETPAAIRFHYQNESGLIEKSISIFENLYLFNWSSGDSFHLPTELKDFIRKFRIDIALYDINDLIGHIGQHGIWNLIDLYVDGVPFNEIKQVDLLCQINITQGTKKNHLDVAVIFHDEEKKPALPPPFLKLFTFGPNGALSSFKRKKEAEEFTVSICDSIKNDNDLYKKRVVYSTRKNQIYDALTDAFKNRYQLVFDEQNSICYRYQYSFLKDFALTFYESFGEAAFKFSFYQNESRELIFQIPTGNLFSGIASFYQKLHLHGVQIFYNRNELQTWKSKIRFERHQSSLQWFDLELNLHEDDLAIIQHADIDSRVALTNSGLLLLTREQQDILRFIKRYTTKDKNGTKSGDFHRFFLPINRARIFELFELKRLGIEGALTEEEEKLCHKLLSLEKMPEYPIPEHLTEILRPYQKTGYNWLRFLYEHRMGACLADDMGLGKTLQTIAFIESVYHKIKRVIVICPVTILLNWEKEIQKFSSMKHYIFHGENRTPPDDCKIIITSYGMMKKEANIYFKDINFDIMVLDEVQHLKNIRSLGAFSARQFKTDFRICLTGTPVENDLSEFYNILDLAMPGIWGDLQFIKTISNQKSRLVARKTAGPFILRRTKSQVLTELPPKTENNVVLPFSDEERAYYIRSLQDVRSRINTAVSRQKYGEILKGLLELRQLCLWQNTDKLHSTKIRFLMENLEQILEENHKVIIFSQFTRYLDIIQKIVHEKHWKFSRIDGSQNMKKRQSEIDKFQDGDSQVFLISLKAGGVGLNLTAASYVFIMDPWWNPAVENQAIDRAHRIGQKNHLTVYRPLIQNSVEEKVLKLQEMKKQLFKDLLPDDNDEIFTGKLSIKDFEMLLS